MPFCTHKADPLPQRIPSPIGRRPFCTHTPKPLAQTQFCPSLHSRSQPTAPMAALPLPPATALASPHLEEALQRLPFTQNDCFCSRGLRQPRPPLKQNASLAAGERPSSAWRASAMAASARMPVVAEERNDTDQAGAAVIAPEGSLFDWNHQWYPVSLTDDLDKRVPTATTVLGRHLVISWDSVEGSWQVCDEIGSDMATSVARAGRDAQSFALCGSLERRSQSAHTKVYPSVEKDGLLWFWPNTRPDFKNIAMGKPPPSIPALMDPDFKDKLYTMNLPYGYKKMIENLLEPACLPFAHGEPELDFFEDFEESLTSTASQLLNKPISGHTYPTKGRPASDNSNVSTHEVRKSALLDDKLVTNGNSNAKLDASVKSHTVWRGATSKSNNNGICNALVKSPPLDACNGGSGTSNGANGRINGSVIGQNAFHEAKRSAGLDSSTSFHSRTASSGNEAENDTLSVTADVKTDSSNADLANANATSQKESVHDNYKILSIKHPEKWADGDAWPQSSAQSEEGSDALKINGSSNAEIRDSKVLSSVVIKKPLSSPRTKFEEKINAKLDDSKNPFDRESEGSIGSSLGLESSLRALRRLIFRKDYELAKKHVMELYKKYPCDAGVLMEYAFVEKQRGDLASAGSLYSKAVSAFKDQQNLGYDYVRALQALGSIEAHARNVKRSRVLFMESIRAARQAEERIPDFVSGASVYGLHAWARLELQHGNWAKARDLLTRAADIQPGNAVVHQSRALLEARAHNWTEARHHFSLAVESAPGDIKCWHAWALFEARQRNVRKMRDLFQKALEVDPDSVHCLQAWAHQETLMGTPDSYDKARSLFQRCIQIDPKSLYAWQAWAVMEKKLRNYDKAQELFEKCLEIKPSSVVCLQALANMERHLKNWGAAQKLLRKALKVEPENAAVLMEAAFVENSLGNTEAAERLFVLAGMADKRKSRVANRIFASRKEVMPCESDRGPRGNIDATGVDQQSERLSIMERKPNLFKAEISGNKQEESDNHSVTTRQSLSHLKHRDDSNDIKCPGVNGAKRASHLKLKKRASTGFQFALDAIQSKLREKSDGDGKPHLRTKQKQKTGAFQFAIDAIEAKQRELKSIERKHSGYSIDEQMEHTDDDLPGDKSIETDQMKPSLVKERKEQPLFPPKQAELVPSMSVT